HTAHPPIRARQAADNKPTHSPSAPAPAAARLARAARADRTRADPAACPATMPCRLDLAQEEVQPALTREPDDPSTARQRRGGVGAKRRGRMGGQERMS